MRVQFTIKTVVMQPTTRCNLDCSYCFLPERKENRTMDPRVAASVARSVAAFDGRVEILWHGGEPLACGLEHFKALTDPFRSLEQTGLVYHHIQTNGTLLNDRWCEFLIERDIRVAISLDGPEWANAQRVDWRGRASFDRILRGVESLRRNGIPFGILAVIGADALERAPELYAYFCDTGCTGVGILIEEPQQLRPRTVPDDEEKVVRFWSDLLECWRKDPRIDLRDFAEILRWMENPAMHNPTGKELYVDMFPTVSFDGAVTLLSPDFANLTRFVAGNVLESSILSIAHRWSEIDYVAEYIAGMSDCRRECEYFDFCLGGTAGNKFFEFGSTGGTETVFCRNARQRPVKAVLNAIGWRARSAAGFRNLRRLVGRHTDEVSKLAREVARPAQKKKSGSSSTNEIGAPAETESSL